MYLPLLLCNILWLFLFSHINFELKKKVYICELEFELILILMS
jgi:hypothetical protein